MAEDHWGEAITDQVGRTPKTDAAVDTDEDRVVSHRTQASDLQSIIASVAENHLGDGRAVILANLQRELETHGQWPQPQSWLDAVAEEMEIGHQYQVGAD